MGDLKKAQQLRARKEMVRQKQQAAIEKRDIRQNATRSENIQRRKKAAEKVGKTFSYASTVTPTVEVGPLNYGSSVKKSSFIKMYDGKGKQTGLMMEGSLAHMESMANYGSPYKKVGPGDPDEKKTTEQPAAAEEFTEAQKLRMAGAALNEDVSFEVETINDPRSSRAVVDIKKRLKKENPRQYKIIYGR